MTGRRGGRKPRFHPRMVVSRFGDVSDGEIDRVTGVMRECYGRLKPHEVRLVDLYLFERSSTAEAFLLRESSEVGVASASFGDLFFATHEAWRGTPRITLCLEKMKELPELVQMGGVRHEVGHSVLHGGLDYYFLPIPPTLLDLAHRYSLPSQYATNLLYLTSIAVKDYEVTRLLHQKGYTEDQTAYAKHLLTVSQDDILSWRISTGKPLAEILCLISCLKALACAAPLLPNKNHEKRIRRHLEESLSHLPPDHSAPLLEVIVEDFPRLGRDTLDNIDRATGFITERIIKPLLEGRNR